MDTSVVIVLLWFIALPTSYGIIYLYRKLPIERVSRIILMIGNTIAIIVALFVISENFGWKGLILIGPPIGLMCDALLRIGEMLRWMGYQDTKRQSEDDLD
jgi:hypothetical protein